MQRLQCSTAASSVCAALFAVQGSTVCVVVSALSISLGVVWTGVEASVLDFYPLDWSTVDFGVPDWAMGVSHSWPVFNTGQCPGRFALRSE